MGQAISEIDWDTATQAELDVLERQIAAKYMRIVPWSAVIWGFANLALWLSLWPLVFMGLLPLWLGFVLAVFTIACSYLPSHEAQHSIIARKGHPLRWLNESLGHLSLIPLVQPFRVMRHTHFEHHAHTNDPTLDPDYGVHAKNTADYYWQYLLKQQPASEGMDSYAQALKRNGKGHMLLDALIYNAIFTVILFSLAWSGYAIEAALLWWLPKKIATAYISYYLSWAPHHPGEQQGRYRETRGFKSVFGNLGSSGMQYHIIHHLYPTIPLSKTPAAYRELKPILQRKGCDLGTL